MNEISKDLGGSQKNCKRRRPWTFWRRMRWTLRVLGLLIIGLIVAAWFARGWLAERAVAIMTERMREKGLFFELGEVSYELGKGIVVRDLTLFETGSKKFPVLKLSNVAVDLGFENILSGEAVDVKTAEIAIEDGFLELFSREKVAEIRGFQFRGVSGPEQIDVSLAEGSINGMIFRAKGTAFKKHEGEEGDQADGAPGKTEEELDEEKKNQTPDFAWLGPVGELIEFHAREKLPVLKLEFRLDEREDAVEKLRVDGVFQGETFRWKTLPLDKASSEFALTWSDKTIDIKKVELVYRGRSITGDLRYELESKRVDVGSLASEVDLMAFLSEEAIGLREPLAGVKIQNPPRLVFHGKVPIEDPKLSQIEVSCESEGSFSLQIGDQPLNIGISAGRAGYHSGILSLEALPLSLFGGSTRIDSFTMDVTQRPLDYTAEVTFSTLDLQQILAIAGKTEAPAGKWSGSYSGRGGFSLAQFEGDAELNGSAGSISLRGPVSLKAGAIAFEGLAIGFGGGTIQAKGQLDAARSPLIYEGAILVDSVPIQAILDFGGIEKKIPGKISGVYQGQAGTTLPSLSGNGNIRLESDIVGVIGPFSIAEGVIESEALVAQFGEGRLQATGRLHAGVSPVVYEGRVDVESVSIQGILDTIGSEKKIPGKISGIYMGSASTSLQSLTGGGNLRYESDLISVAGPFSISEDRIETEEMAAEFGGGKIVAAGGLKVSEMPPLYQGALAVENVSVQSILDACQIEKTVPGILTGDFDGTIGTTLTSVAGSGNVQYATEDYRVFGPLTIREGIVGSENLAAEIGGGVIQAQGGLNLVSPTLIYEGATQVDGVAIQSIVALVGSEQEIEGKLIGDFTGTGGLSLGSLNGTGKVRIEDGKIYSVPVIGQLTSFLSNALPAFGKIKKSDLTADFTITEGVFQSKNLVAASDMTRIEVAGELDFNDMTAELTAQAKVEGVIGVATEVVSRLLEVEASGPVSELKFGLSNSAGGAVKGTAGAAADAVKGTVGIAKDSVTGATNMGTDAIKAGVNGMKKAGNQIGKIIPGFGKDDKKMIPEEPGGEKAGESKNKPEMTLAPPVEEGAKPLVATPVPVEKTEEPDAGKPVPAPAPTPAPVPAPTPDSPQPKPVIPAPVISD